MSDIFFTDAGEAPVPPDEVRIRELEAQPRPDGRRVRVHTALTPFQKRPNIEVLIHNAGGSEVAAVSVVEAIDATMDFTMHLREQQTGGQYTLSMSVFYADVEAAQGSAPSAGEMLGKARNVIDERQIAFEIPQS
jgi:hypothetical protein